MPAWVLPPVSPGSGAMHGCCRSCCWPRTLLLTAVQKWTEALVAFSLVVMVLFTKHSSKLIKKSTE